MSEGREVGLWAGPGSPGARARALGWTVSATAAGAGRGGRSAVAGAAEPPPAP